MTDSAEMTSGETAADPIADVFPSESVAARFVVAMSIARNDIELALRDAVAAADRDRPDFTYRVRLSTSHLVEALDSLMSYSKAFPEVRNLTARMPREHRKHLAEARRVVQQVGDRALNQIRNNTFHFPAPDTNYSPTSDAQLLEVLAAMGDRPCELYLDHRGPSPVVTLTFANDVALALALAKHSPDETTAGQQFELTSRGAVAFVKWADALLVTYLRITGGSLGQPQLVEGDAANRAGQE